MVSATEFRISDPDSGGAIYRGGRLYRVESGVLVDVGAVPVDILSQIQSAPPVNRDAIRDADSKLMARLSESKE